HPPGPSLVPYTTLFRSGAQGLGHQDGGGAVSGADDADGGGVLQVEAQHDRDDDGQEDTGLSSSAAQEQLGVGQQRPEVDHGADADRKSTRLNSSHVSIS